MWVMRVSGKTSTLFKIHGSPDGIDIVTVSPAKITAQPGRIWQETAESCSGGLRFVRWVVDCCLKSAGHSSLARRLTSEFLSLLEDNALNDDFGDTEITMSWSKFPGEYPILRSRAMRKLVPSQSKPRRGTDSFFGAIYDDPCR